MISANELRIGNWVIYYSKPDYCKVDSVDIHNIYKKNMCNDEIHLPIPITPDILEKCGFERMPLSSVKRYKCKQTIFYLQKSKEQYFVYGYKFYPAAII